MDQSRFVIFGDKGELHAGGSLRDRTFNCQMQLVQTGLVTEQTVHVLAKLRDMVVLSVGLAIAVQFSSDGGSTWP